MLVALLGNPVNPVKREESIYYGHYKGHGSLSSLVVVAVLLQYQEDPPFRPISWSHSALSPWPSVTFQEWVATWGALATPPIYPPVQWQLTWGRMRFGDLGAE